MFYNKKNAISTPGHFAMHEILRSGSMMKNTARQFFRDKPTSDVQFHVLLQLKYSDHLLTQKELSEKLLVDKSNLTGLVDRMEKAGHIRRLAVPGDRRCYHLQLTEAGAEVAAQVEPAYLQLINQLTCDFTDDEMEQLTSLIQKLQHNMEKYC